MLKSLSRIAATATLAVGLSAAAHAAVDCGDALMVTGNDGYISCLGPLEGNIASNKVNLVSFAGYGDFALVGTSDDAGSGPFASIGEDSLSFDATQYGTFVLGIKGGPSYSLYLFDAGTTGISALSFDTLGIVKGNGRAGPDLSHLGLFAAVVPEPASYAMMFAGLALIGLTVRRRRG
jgi:hypothetical protein